jgi:hypothetical protein
MGFKDAWRAGPIAGGVMIRRDLRTGITAARTLPSEAADIHALATAARAALACDPSRRGLVVAPLSAHLLKDPIALDASLTGYGLSPAVLGFEIAEADLAASDDAGEALSRLRARGWSLTLALAAGCPSRFGVRERALLCEITVPSAADGVLQAEGRLARRIAAARADGLIVSIVGEGAPHPARVWMSIGADRADVSALPAPPRLVAAI